MRRTESRFIGVSGRCVLRIKKLARFERIKADKLDFESFRQLVGHNRFRNMVDSESLHAEESGRRLACRQVDVTGENP
jgi:hypothetical protein